jgi:phage terminase Nu1 subunit (DNA packaging protein)
VILSGWKSIAEHLRCGVRTVQRWEDAGLPISRPYPGRRSHVVADSQELDLWLRHGAAMRGQNSDLIARLDRSRKMRADVEKSRKTLRERLNILRNEVAPQQATAEQIRGWKDPSRKRKPTQSGAA